MSFRLLAHPTSNRLSHSRRALLVLCCAMLCAPLARLFADGIGQPEVGEFLRTETTPSNPARRVPTEEEPLSLAPIPPRPANRIFDDARLFSPDGRTALAETLERAHTDDDLDIYIVATTFILGESIEDRAHRIADAWVKAPKGFVLLYVRGEQTMTMSTPGEEEPFLSVRTLRALYEEAIRGAANESEAPARIRSTLDSLITGVREASAERERMERVFNPDVTRLLAFFLGALSCLGAAGWGLWRLLRSFDHDQDSRFIFPPVSVPLRFGAPFGGGVCGETQFASRRRA